MDLIDFEWVRCRDGSSFRVVPLTAKRRVPAWTQGSTVVKLPVWSLPSAPNVAIETAGHCPFDLYRPAQSFPALFQIFADAQPTPEGMCDFFNRFGPLEFTDPHPGRISLRELAGPVLMHQAALRGAIQALSAGDLTELTERFNTGWGELKTKLAVVEGSLSVSLVPASLIQFLWLQFALHTASDAKLLRCERCSAPFVVGTGTGRRETAKFCSNACKVATFKKRREGRAANA